MPFKPRTRAAVTTAISVVTLTYAWGAAIVPGLDDVDGKAKALWITSGALATLAGFTLPAIEQFLRISKMENAEVEVLVRLNDALDPIVGQLGRITTAFSPVQLHELQQQSIPMVLHSAAQLVGGDRVRACWFVYETSPRKCLRPVMAQGRCGTPSTCFDGSTDIGKQILRALRDNESQFYPNLDENGPIGWHAHNSSRPRTYRTFISVPVVAGSMAYGLLTVDALQPGHLGEEDVSFLRILAGLLASSLATTLAQG